MNDSNAIIKYPLLIPDFLIGTDSSVTNTTAANNPMIAITTNNSIKVKPSLGVVTLLISLRVD
jgi:hypothetical protein